MITVLEFETFAKKLKSRTITSWSFWRYQIDFQTERFTFTEMKEILKTQQPKTMISAYYDNQYMGNFDFWRKEGMI